MRGGLESPIRFLLASVQSKGRLAFDKLRVRRDTGKEAGISGAASDPDTFVGCAAESREGSGGTPSEKECRRRPVDAGEDTMVHRESNSYGKGAGVEARGRFITDVHDLTLMHSLPGRKRHAALEPPRYESGKSRARI